MIHVWIQRSWKTYSDIIPIPYPPSNTSVKATKPYPIPPFSFRDTSFEKRSDKEDCCEQQNLGGLVEADGEVALLVEGLERAKEGTAFIDRCQDHEGRYGASDTGYGDRLYTAADDRRRISRECCGRSSSVGYIERQDVDKSIDNLFPVSTFFFRNVRWGILDSLR